MNREPSPTLRPKQNPRARYIMIGGFLGAGKTTAVAALAKRLVAQGQRVGLITNDQGRHLVDTAMLRAHGFATEEIPGGCFCCRFNSLVEASRRLTASTRPEVFLAEPVGSCTDLVATVTYPLRRLYGDDFTVAPVSVLVDPVRAERIFGLSQGGAFSSKVRYIYLKQVEEADLVVISKCDLIEAPRWGALREAIQDRFPKKEVLAVSARTGANLDGWFGRLTSDEQAGGTAMEVDYQVYAEGEALLGWLNGTVQLSTRVAIDAEAFLKELAGAIQKHLRSREAEVAHLKMTVSPDDSVLGEIAAVSLVRNDFVPELSFRLEPPIRSGQLIVNLRAEAAPDVLGTAVREGLAAAARKFPGLEAVVDHLEHFRPGKPTPTHRVERLAA